MLINVDYQTAQRLLLQQAAPLAVEEIPLINAYDRVPYQGLRAPLSIPSGPCSAVDGYALHPADLDAAGPLRVVNLSFLDIAQYRLQKGETAPVNTGFPVPRNTAAVIPHEGVEMEGGYLLAGKRVKAGSNIRLPGEDFQPGELLFPANKRLTAGMIAAAAACGITSIHVYRKPRVGILNLSPYHTIRPITHSADLLPDSNGPLLASLVTRDRGEVAWVSDQFDQDLSEIDLLLTTGGTYAEGKSEAQSLLETLGATILFWGTSIQPGGHNGAGVIGSTLAVCLSGNPAACAVGYELLVSPVLRRLQGMEPDLLRLMAACVNDVSVTARRTPRFLRGRARCCRNGWEVEVLPGQKASMIRSLLDYNALIEIPGGISQVTAGTEIEIIMVGQ